MPLIDLTSKQFGLLTVISQAPFSAKTRHSRWLCRCQCGNECVSGGGLLRLGLKKSCGCQTVRTGSPKPEAFKKRHHMSGTPEYTAWQQMKWRCKYHPNYAGKGVCVCEEWLKFERFYADMGDRPSPEHSLDRKDPFGNYEPSNCRWAMVREQANNKRKPTIPKPQQEPRGPEKVKNPDAILAAIQAKRRDLRIRLRGKIR